MDYLKMDYKKEALLQVFPELGEINIFNARDLKVRQIVIASLKHHPALLNERGEGENTIVVSEYLPNIHEYTIINSTETVLQALCRIFIEKKIKPKEVVQYEIYNSEIWVEIYMVDFDIAEKLDANTLERLKEDVIAALKKGIEEVKKGETDAVSI